MQWKVCVCLDFNVRFLCVIFVTITQKTHSVCLNVVAINKVGRCTSSQHVGIGEKKILTGVTSSVITVRKFKVKEWGIRPAPAPHTLFPFLNISKLSKMSRNLELPNVLNNLIQSSSLLWSLFFKPI